MAHLNSRERAIFLFDNKITLALFIVMIIGQIFCCSFKMPEKHILQFMSEILTCTMFKE